MIMLSDILISKYPNHSFSISEDGTEILSWQGELDCPTEEEIAAMLSDDVIVEVRKVYRKQIEQTLDVFPQRVYGVSKEMITIYERKQLLVNTWPGPGIPEKVEVEWEYDWSLRPEFIANEWIEVDLFGTGYRCATANDMWETWKIKTALGNYMDIMSEPLRTSVQSKIDVATTEEEIQTLMVTFLNDLYSLPSVFIRDILPELILASGLVPVTQ